MLLRKLVVVSCCCSAPRSAPRATGHRSGTARTSTAGRPGCNALADLRGAGPGEGRGRQLPRADRVGPRSAEGFHGRQRRRRPAGDPDLRRGLRRAAHEGDVQGLPPQAAVQVGREEVAAARQAGDAARQRPAVSRARGAGRRTGAPGRARSNCRFRNTTSAISTRSGRRSPFAPRREPARQPRSTITIRPASGRSSRRARARPADASSSPTTRSRPVSGTPSS